MSAADNSTQDYLSQQYIEFSIAAAQEGKNKDLSAIYNSFTPFHDLRYSKVFRRSGNGELRHVRQGNTRED
jgi:hypothetical protein